MLIFTAIKNHLYFINVIQHKYAWNKNNKL